MELTQIKHGNKTYNLKIPLLIKETKYAESQVIFIENDELKIFGTGRTMERTMADLSEDFDYLYERLNGLKDSQLGKDMLKTKNYINSIVESITTT